MVQVLRKPQEERTKAKVCYPVLVFVWDRVREQVDAQVWNYVRGRVEDLRDRQVVNCVREEILGWAWDKKMRYHRTHG